MTTDNTPQPDSNGWYLCANVLPPFGLQVRLWKTYENGSGEESHGNRQSVYPSENWIRDWIWSTPDGTTDENPKDVPYRYTHWQSVTPPTDP